VGRPPAASAGEWLSVHRAAACPPILPACLPTLPACLQVTAPQLALLEETMSRMERVAAFLLVS
jgi:hypothetical protein